MTLYHYTSIESFRKIWESKKLLFSQSKNMNDFFERFKTFVLTQDTFVYEGKELDRSRFDHFDKRIREELDKYRQVSFTYDYKDGLRGFASPMMWGQYAWSKDEQGNWQNGVCIAIESEKIVSSSSNVLPSIVSYNPIIIAPKVINVDFTQKNAAQSFVESNIDTYFFKKHVHWEHENEYRFICRNEGELDISNAIKSIYVLWDNNTPLDEIRSIVKDDSLIRLVTPTTMVNQIGSHYQDEPDSLQEINEMQERMRNFKWN